MEHQFINDVIIYSGHNQVILKFEKEPEKMWYRIENDFSDAQNTQTSV